MGGHALSQDLDLLPLELLESFHKQNLKPAEEGLHDFRQGDVEPAGRMNGELPVRQDRRHRAPCGPNPVGVRPLLVPVEVIGPVVLQDAGLDAELVEFLDERFHQATLARVLQAYDVDHKRGSGHVSTLASQERYCSISVLVGGISAGFNSIVTVCR